MRKKRTRENGEHEVTITVTIAKASITAHDYEKKHTDQPQVQNYFHCEYKLLPDDKDATKTDVVTFGLAAKMYGDNDSKVLRTWLEGNKTWVAWTTSKKILVTQDLLLRMFKHKVELKVWDSRDKVSAKARFDRPKAFRLPANKGNDEVDLSIIRDLLKKEGKTNAHLAARIQDMISTPSDQAERRKVNFMNSEDTIDEDHPTRSPERVVVGDSKLEVQVLLDKNKQPHFKNLMSLAAAGDNLILDTEEEDEPTHIKGPAEPRSSRQGKKGKKKKKPDGDSMMTLHSQREEQKIQKIKQNGLACISLPLSSLFTECTVISNNLKDPVSSLEEVILIVSIDHLLLSEEQRASLNPMVLTVSSARQMPGSAVDHAKMQDMYLPPYIVYKFHDEEKHQSEGMSHGKTIKFNDKDVILLGTKNKGPLFEYLQGPKFRIEVHDRDSKEADKSSYGVFGSHVNDEVISSATSGSSTKYNPFDVKRNGFSAYGYAEFDLSDLVKGEKVLELMSPIKDCLQSDFGRRSSNIQKTILKEEDTYSDKHHPAAYLEYGSELRIKLELAMPLIDTKHSTFSTSSLHLVPSSEQCPFGRLVYVFDYENRSFLKELLSLLTEINAHALGLSSFPRHVIEAALSTYKLSDEQRASKELDIVTGIQIIDGTYHIFILEGIHKEGIQKLWTTLQRPPVDESKHFHTLYNSDLTFSDRMYVSLDVDLTRVRLHESLEKIMRQPLLHVRDMVPRPCFQAVSKLYQLSRTDSLRSAIRNELFPTDVMVVSLSREFGVPLSLDDHIDDTPTNDKSKVVEGEITSPNLDTEEGERQLTTSRLWTPLQTRNPTYEKLISQREDSRGQTLDFIQENIKILQTYPKPIREPRGVSCDERDLFAGVAHNYSTQTLNSTEIARAKLRNLMAQEPNSRFTYCQEHNSATLVPVDVKAVERDNLLNSKRRFRTKEGFTFPGVKTSLQSNKHEHRPDTARLDELKKPWKENILHGNILKPSVDRVFFDWSKRDIDFNTWKAAEPFFGKPSPVTIHSAGDTLTAEKKGVEEEESRKWRRKLVVDDPQLKTHRCLIATELTNRGSKASNLLSRSEDPLKDPPHKHSLAAPGMVLDPIPRLSVVSYPNVDTHKRETGQLKPLYTDYSLLEKNAGFAPGPYENRSWSLEKNKIPIKDYEHARYEKQHGQDFRLVHKTRNVLTERAMIALTEEERDTHLFRKPSALPLPS